MNRQDFNTWLHRHCIAFPEVEAWTDSHGDTQALLDMWAETLERVGLDDAMRCTRRMMSGEVQHPSRFEISRLPAAVIEACPVSIVPASELIGKHYNAHTGTIS